MTKQLSTSGGVYMAELSVHPTLPELQQYMDETCKERGWTKDSYAEKFLLFTEEVGELAKAIRKTHGIYQEQAKQKHLELEEEFDDVLSYLLYFTTFFQVSWLSAFRDIHRDTDIRLSK